MSDKFKLSDTVAMHTNLIIVLYIQYCSITVHTSYNLNVTRACVAILQNVHTLLLHKCTFMFLSLTPRTREKTHELRGKRKEG